MWVSSDFYTSSFYLGADTLRDPLLWRNNTQSRSIAAWLTFCIKFLQDYRWRSRNLSFFVFMWSENKERLNIQLYHWTGSLIDRCAGWGFDIFSFQLDSRILRHSHDEAGHFRHPETSRCFETDNDSVKITWWTEVWEYNCIFNKREYILSHKNVVENRCTYKVGLSGDNRVNCESELTEIKDVLLRR